MIRPILLVGLGAAVLFAQDADKSADSRLRNATVALREIMRSPDKGISRDLLHKAQCAVVIPDLLKGAFLVGGKYGRGYATCRRGNGWSAPAAVRIEGGSFGLQLGGSSTDLVMLVMNQHGMERLLSDKFTIGGEATAAAGPIGRDTSAQTDIAMHAEILTWSRSRGVFAGISLDGATMRPDNSENKKLYGREITNREILEGPVSAPPGTREFMATLSRFSREANAPTEARRDRREPRENHEPAAALNRPGGRLTLGENQIHFATNQSAVPPEAEPVLARLAQSLKDNPTWKIRIEGYTDNVGSREANRALSQQRAESVMNWLADHGVDRGRMNAEGRGESRSIGDNSTDDGRAKNRRVEIVRTDGMMKTGE